MISHGKRDFADIFKVTHLNVGITQVSPIYFVRAFKSRELFHSGDGKEEVRVVPTTSRASGTAGFEDGRGNVRTAGSKEPGTSNYSC